MAIGIGALQRCQGKVRSCPVGPAQDSAEHDSTRLGSCLVSRYDGSQPDVLGPQEVIESTGTEPAVAFRAQLAGGGIHYGMAYMNPVYIRIGRAAGRIGVAGTARVRAVLGCCRQSCNVAVLASRRDDTAVKSGAMTAIAGVEVGRGPVPEPGGAERIRAGDVETRRNLQDRGMGSVGLMAGFAAGCQAAQDNVETGIAAGSAAGLVGMAGLAEGQVGLGGGAVLGRVGPSCRMTNGAMTESAVEAGRSAVCVSGYERRSEVCSPEMAPGADSGIQSLGIIYRTGMCRSGCSRPPGECSMGSVHRHAVMHVAGAVRAAGSETADLRRTARQIGPVTDLATGESLV
jgi:hypothetical protein